jgi:putative ABC transport system permease protein
MKARVGSRVVLTFQDLNNDLVSVSCRVTGIFQSANTMYDELNVYLLQSDLSQLLGDESIVNEIAIVIDDYRESAQFADQYGKLFPDFTIRYWAEISPQLGFYNEMGMTMFFITLIIILWHWLSGCSTPCLCRYSKG